MHITGKVSGVEVKGKLKTLTVKSDGVQKTSITITANPPRGHEITVGDTVDIHIHPKDGSKLGVTRHPRK
jgi:hypothetical protein